MRAGAVFPQLEIGTDAGAIRAFAQAVEELGLAHVLAYDHVLGADVARDDPRMASWPAAHYTHRDAFHEPLVLFAYLAGVTRTLELATGILVLPQRQTALVAKQVAELDLVSDGRVRLGVGIGWNHLEYEALGVPFARRGAQLEEQIAVLRALWSDPVVERDGAFHALPRVGIEPRPSRPIPLWMGGRTARAMRRAARLADGWVAPAGTAAALDEGWIDQLRAALRDAGREGEPFGIDGRVELRGRSDDEIAAEVERWRALGATHLSGFTMAPPDRRDERLGVDEHLALLARFAAVTRELV